MIIKDCRIVYMGTPEISAYVLDKLILDGFNIVAVVSQPDRPVGRKREILPTPTKKVAEKYGIPVYQKEKIKLDYDFLYNIKPDLILTLAFGQIVPQGLLDIPKLGCLNLHGSLLPKYRGAAPIQYALINNDDITGMSLMQMTNKMDAGVVYATNSINIEEEDNSTSLFIKMADLAYQLAKTNIPLYIDGKLKGIEQKEELVTFAPTIKKEEEKLDINYPIKKIYGYIRALSEKPGAYFIFEDKIFKIYKAKIYSNEIKGKLGEFIESNSKHLLLQCVDGILSIIELQVEGKGRTHYINFVNGHNNLVGKIVK